mmetsp:Transcript_17266/g.17451  ORF Transcript_17266/g.17451 Transcript_17266/m.17451 type:complete len:91 (+) Transcript_17266:950-1222(+)
MLTVCDVSDIATFLLIIACHISQENRSSFYASSFSSTGKFFSQYQKFIWINVCYLPIQKQLQNLFNKKQSDSMQFMLHNLFWQNFFKLYI